jgi:hypothetical protein
MPVTQYCCFREVVTDDLGTHYLTPRDDPMEYEFPINFIFDTHQQATDWLADPENLDAWGIDPEECREWVIVEVVETVVATVVHLFPKE